MVYSGWKQLTQNCSAKGEGRFPIPAYSEFMPPPRFGCRPYRGILDRLFFSEEDPAGWPVTEALAAIAIEAVARAASEKPFRPRREQK